MRCRWMYLWLCLCLPLPARASGPALSAAEQTQATQALRASGHTLDTDGDTLVVRAVTTP